jgi:hypothetical protein
MTVSAGLGIANFPFADHRGFWQWVDLCDNGGVDSIWQSDRIISTDPQLEVMSVMAALAGGSKRLKFGMNVASLGLRDPVITAKACASIDVMSGGRLLPAFGLGSAQSRDYVATGTPTRGRGKRADEGLEIMSRLWSEEHVTFQGEHYRLDSSRCRSGWAVRLYKPLNAPRAGVRAGKRASNPRSRSHRSLPGSRNALRRLVAPSTTTITARASPSVLVVRMSLSLPAITICSRNAWGARPTASWR